MAEFLNSGNKNGKQNRDRTLAEQDWGGERQERVVAG
jgi:hypothetical protein